MKQTINKSQFVDAFATMGRENQFTYGGKSALFDYLESTEEDTGEVELDVIALCCEFTEYENLKEFQGAYSADDYTSIGDVEQATTVIRIDDERFIIQQF
jgi:hypothetical protein